MGLRERQRLWLKGLIAATGLSATALARKSGLAQTTLTRFLSSSVHGSALSARTVEAIETAAAGTLGFAQGEAVPFQPADADIHLAEAVGHIVSERGGLDSWRLSSRALEAAGYKPSDVLIVDVKATPRVGDVVCAQRLAGDGAPVETVFRIFAPPALVAQSHDSSIIPALPLGEDVVVRGVVIATLRGRNAR